MKKLLNSLKPGIPHTFKFKNSEVMFRKELDEAPYITWGYSIDSKLIDCNSCSIYTFIKYIKGWKATEEFKFFLEQLVLEEL